MRRARRFAKTGALAVAASVLVSVLILFLVAQADRLLNRVRFDGSVPISTEARELHRMSFVVDLHSDALMWNRDPLERNALGHVDLPRLVEGGVKVQVMSVGTNMALGPSWSSRSERWPDYYTFHALALRWPRRTISSQLQRALYMAERLHDAVSRAQGRLRIVRSAEELESLVGEGQAVGTLLSLEGAHALEGELPNLDVLYEAGFRIIGLAHFIDNPFAGSANGMKRGGLTPLGVELLGRMEQLGVVPDLAHASSQTIRDVSAATRKPLLVTHTGVRSTCNRARNLSDDDIRIIAESGGVIGVAFGELLLCGRGIDRIVDSIQHVANLVGDEHVALGSDFDGGVTTPFDASGLPQLTAAMMAAGMSEASIRRVLGENARRVLGAWLPRTLK